jgi:hypothetical protein
LSGIMKSLDNYSSSETGLLCELKLFCIWMILVHFIFNF